MAKAKPTDVTGRVREQLMEEQAQAMADRAAEMSMATAQAQAKIETEVVDATKPNRQTVIVDDPVTVGSTDDATVEIRVIQDIENMTLGKGNNYNFKAGVKYKVTKQVASHLKEKGYLAGVI
jgi:sRNA-binding protein